MKDRYRYLPEGGATYTGAAERYVDFVIGHQLTDRATWKNFVEIFRTDFDSTDNGWRCEYFGKMMRAAALICRYRPDDGLYAVLEDAVRDLLTTQRPDGRFSTYAEDHQLCGWDLWGRKYVITGLLHFSDICRDDDLKKEILAALRRHADAIVATVGEGEGKKPILETSHIWGSVNSCSILEPMVDLYTRTGEKRYLDFASYIISTGGCKYGNLIECALKNRKMPFEYPESKAYETMSFFEGLLAYFEVTGERRYLVAVRNLVEQIAETDLTVIGCSGCKGEEFDHSTLTQTIFKPCGDYSGLMQETCVTVTWMRLLSRLYLLTGERKYFDRLEVSAWNAMYGAVNLFDERGNSFEINGEVRLPFDSYSPLYNNRRGMGVGGFKKFPFGGYYGCCACIAAAGIALPPLLSAVESDRGMTVSGWLPGKVSDSAGLSLSIVSDYPAVAKMTLTVTSDTPIRRAVRIRIPDFLSRVRVGATGKKTIPIKAGYAVIEKVWKKGDRITVSGKMSVKATAVNDRFVFTYGAITLARDTAKEGIDDLSAPVAWKEPLAVTALPAEGGEVVRFALERADGEPPLLLTDYASCGKRWGGARNVISAFVNKK